MGSGGGEGGGDLVSLTTLERPMVPHGGLFSVSKRRSGPLVRANRAVVRGGRLVQITSGWMLIVSLLLLFVVYLFIYIRTWSLMFMLIFNQFHAFDSSGNTVESLVGARAVTANRADWDSGIDREVIRKAPFRILSFYLSASRGAWQVSELD